MVLIHLIFGIYYICHVDDLFGMHNILPCTHWIFFFVFWLQWFASYLCFKCFWWFIIHAVIQNQNWWNLHVVDFKLLCRVILTVSPKLAIISVPFWPRDAYFCLCWWCRYKCASHKCQIDYHKYFFQLVIFVLRLWSVRWQHSFALPFSCQFFWRCISVNPVAMFTLSFSYVSNAVWY